jgi:phage replication-related protein YjqB (UPF0714/DUF867 family)
MDRYSSFFELAGHQTEGVDFKVEYVCRNSPVAVIAPHGGEIEPFTSELAEMIAGSAFSYYTFKGVKASGNRHLHITSHRFDEPRALTLVSRSEIVLAIHGHKNVHEAFVMVGGKDTRLSASLTTALANSGFSVKPPRKGLHAVHPRNLCNRGKRGKGVQIELSRKLRISLRSDASSCQKLAGCIRCALITAGTGRGISLKR